jgi:hypothetical protein
MTMCLLHSPILAFDPAAFVPMLVSIEVLPDDRHYLR